MWSESCCLSGNNLKHILIRVRDEKQNVLETLAISVESLRVMFPYHIRLRFKEEFMGAYPEIYFSIVRESYPMFSIMEVPVRFGIKGLTQ